LQDVRLEYFSNVIAHARKSPHEFPDPADRKKRVLEDLPVAPPPPPKVLTRAEIKAQRKADLHSLNILKTRLQPIMDQIHRKYRKFRQPVIPMNQVAYLFDEQDPNYVRPDLAEGERRPYEVARDREGTEGIRDTVTGKFFYNLETTTIEERLANGYYCRPRDFYADINRLYNDAKNIGDRERALKANELRTNVEVDVTDIELQLTNMGIKFEEIYERQLTRAKELATRAAKKAAMQNVVDLVQTDITQENDSDSQGPVGIGFPIPGASTTRARFQVMSPPSNGHGAGSSSHLTNGNSVPSRHNGDDTEMGGMEEETQPNTGPSDFMCPPWPPAGGSRVLGESTRATAGTTQISQVSAITTVPPGMSPSAIVNDASTTKTSDPSTGNRGSDWSTQRTNGLQNSNPEEQSQMPDTQQQSQQFASQGPSQSTSDSQWPHSQAQGMLRGVIKAPPTQQHSPVSSQAQPGPSTSNAKPAAAANAAIGNILNNNDPSENHSSNNSSLRNSGVSTNSSQHQQTVVDEAGLSRFLDMIAEKTSGCTIEQLEQINRELMDEIWKTRHEWNRTKVLTGLRAVFNETIADIEALQGLEASSQDRPPQDERGEEAYVVLR
jgi:hypothetical protein